MRRAGRRVDRRAFGNDRDLLLAVGRAVVQAHLPLDHVHDLGGGVDVKLAAIFPSARDEHERFRLLPQHADALAGPRELVAFIK